MRECVVDKESKSIHFVHASNWYMPCVIVHVFAIYYMYVYLYMSSVCTCKCVANFASKYMCKCIKVVCNLNL